jgi:YVTN family beta-propeller protein
MKFLQTLTAFGLGLQAVMAQVQAPALPGEGAPISASDRIYTGDQSSNTITVIKPLTNEVLGTIALGDSRLTDVLGPQYQRAVNSHGLGFSRDGRFIVSLSVTSNTVTVIRCEDNTIQSQTFADRQTHEAFFSADNRTVWVGTRGVEHIDIIDGINGGIIGYVESYGGPSKVLFSPDGRIAYANHIRGAWVSVIDVASRRVIHNITGLADSFSSDMMLSADGLRLWVAHKMVGKMSIISTTQRKVIAVLDTGVETNHPNFATVDGIVYGFTTVAAVNLTRVYKQPDPDAAPVFVRDILATGIEPHGLWPSPDNTHMYVVNEHTDTVDFISLETWSVVKTVKVGQEGQALVYVANAVPNGNGTQNLGTQGLSENPATNKLVNVRSSGVHHNNATALITIRPEPGLDMFQVIGRNLKLNRTYIASASCLNCNGLQIPLVNFTASTPTSMGCGTAPQVLAFFNFFGVYDADTLQVTEV